MFELKPATGVERMAWTPEEFAEAHRIGRTAVFMEIASGRLNAMKLGRRTIITKESGAEWRTAREAESKKAREAETKARAGGAA